MSLVDFEEKPSRPYRGKLEELSCVSVNSGDMRVSDGCGETEEEGGLDIDRANDSAEDTSVNSRGRFGKWMTRRA